MTQLRKYACKKTNDKITTHTHTKRKANRGYMRVRTFDVRARVVDRLIR